MTRSIIETVLSVELAKLGFRMDVYSVVKA